MLEPTSEFSRVSNWDAIMLCIPTPLDDHFEPNLSFVTGTLESVVPHLRIGQVISLESTTYPGTTEEEVVSRTKGAGFTIGKDLFVVYSPERGDPGNPKFSVTNMSKVVGGHTPEYLAAGVARYQSAFDQVLPVSSTKVAYLNPHVPVVGPTRARMNWAGHHSLDWSAKNLSSQDVIVIATHYATFDLHDLAQHATLIVDTRNAMNGIPTKPGQLAKA